MVQERLDGEDVIHMPLSVATFVIRVIEDVFL
jgi:hypothetical protein